jgi:hypothetical protein
VKSCLFAILGTLVLATGASASIISFSATIPTLGASSTSQVNLTKFNTNLGTLTGVTLELDPTAHAIEQIINLTGGPATFSNAMTTVGFTLTGPDGTHVPLLLVAGPFSGTALTGTTSNPGNTVTGVFTADVSPLNLAFYEGTGPLALTAATSSASSTGSHGTLVAGGFNFFGFGGDAAAGGTARVTFTFAPTTTAPEPATLGLLGSALLGLGAISRLRKVRKA